MKPPRQLHPWDVSPREARDIQDRLRSLVISQEAHDPIETVAGIDVGFEDGGRITRAAVAVLGLSDLTPLDEAVVRRPTSFPYVPGLLSFREIPAVLDALERLRLDPDLLVCDGQGYAHPRRFGLACHLGVLCDLPSIGAAKSRLIGEHAALDSTRGAVADLMHQGEVIGAVVRTRTGVQPLYVSVGHRVSLPEAVRLVLACAPRYRLPETTRRAHRLASGPAEWSEGP